MAGEGECQGTLTVRVMLVVLDGDRETQRLFDGVRTRKLHSD